MAQSAREQPRALLAALQQRKGADVIKALVSPEAAATRDWSYGLLPFFWALSYGASQEVLRLLLEANPEAANERHPREGWTPLHYAEQLDQAAVSLLLEKCPGALSVRDKAGQLPLHWAAAHNAPCEVIEVLLKAYPGAAHERDNAGRVPYVHAKDGNASQALLDLLKAANPAGAVSTKVTVEEPLPVVLLFPGQGSQYVKMLSEVQHLPPVREMLQQAKDILGYDLLQVCLEGPEERLQDTLYCQPAMYVAGLAAVEKLKVEDSKAVQRPMALAGLSLGEYTALTVAGVLTFADGLRLVKERAEAMQEAANMRPQAMLSIAGLEEEKVKELCQQARSDVGGEEVCQISNYLFQKGYAVGGTQSAVERCLELAKEANVLQAKLIKTSGGFHTPLMEPARKRLQAKLTEILPKMSRPRCKVYMNVDGRPIDAKTDPQRIADLMGRQLTSPVRWTDSIEAILKTGGQACTFYECGPMKQLKSMMKRIDADAWGRTVNIDV